MKKFIITVFTVVAITGMAVAQTPTAQVSNTNEMAAPAAECKWEKTTFNFGAIPQGKPVSVVYNFTNTGKAPLILTNVHPSCGCTTEDYSKESIAPGKKGFVKLTYNANAMGTFTKTTTVLSNAGDFTLQFNGEVVAAK